MDLEREKNGRGIGSYRMAAVKGEKKRENEKEKQERWSLYPLHLKIS